MRTPYHTLPLVLSYLCIPKLSPTNPPQKPPGAFNLTAIKNKLSIQETTNIMEENAIETAPTAPLEESTKVSPKPIETLDLTSEDTSSEPHTETIAIDKESYLDTINLITVSATTNADTVMDVVDEIVVALDEPAVPLNQPKDDDVTVVVVESDQPDPGIAENTTTVPDEPIADDVPDQTVSGIAENTTTVADENAVVEESFESVKQIWNQTVVEEATIEDVQQQSDEYPVAEEETIVKIKPIAEAINDSIMLLSDSDEEEFPMKEVGKPVSKEPIIDVIPKDSELPSEDVIMLDEEESKTKEEVNSQIAIADDVQIIHPTVSKESSNDEIPKEPNIEVIPKDLELPTEDVVMLDEEESTTKEELNPQILIVEDILTSLPVSQGETHIEEIPHDSELSTAQVVNKPAGEDAIVDDVQTSKPFSTDGIVEVIPKDSELPTVQVATDRNVAEDVVMLDETESPINEVVRPQNAIVDEVQTNQAISTETNIELIPKDPELPPVQVPTKPLPDDDDDVIMLEEDNSNDNKVSRPSNLSPDLRELLTSYPLPSSPINSDPPTVQMVAKECINCECPKQSAHYLLADLSVLNHFKIPRKPNRSQYVCQSCMNDAIDKYSELCGILNAHQPLLLEPIPKQPVLVEIIDSSDDEENNDYQSDNSVSRDELVPADVLKLIETDFEDSLARTLQRVNIDQQMSWTTSILRQNVEHNRIRSGDISAELLALQKLADGMAKRLYQTTGCVLKELPAFDLNTNEPVQIYGPDNPPEGALVYPEVTINQPYYAVRQKLMSAWMTCKVIEITDSIVVGFLWIIQYYEFEIITEMYLQLKRKQFKVRYTRNKGVNQKVISGLQLAYYDAPNVRLKEGKF